MTYKLGVTNHVLSGMILQVGSFCNLVCLAASVKICATKTFFFVFFMFFCCYMKSLTWISLGSKFLRLAIWTIWMDTPPKFNVDTKNDGLESVSPFKHGNFGYLC